MTVFSNSRGHARRIRCVPVLCLLLAAACGARAGWNPAAGRPVPAAPPSAAVPGRLLVKFRPNTDSAALRHALHRHGGAHVGEIRGIRVQLVRVDPEHTARTLAGFRAESNVLYAEPDYIARAAYTPNDSYYITDQYGPQRMQADLAWDHMRGDTNVVLAILDTGVEAGHPDLAPNLTPGYDFINDDSDPADDDGHGTHVAGIAGAIADNGTGIAGIGFSVGIMPVKVLNRRGEGAYSDIAAGMVYAADNGARVINMSLSGSADSATLSDAVDYAWSQGVLLVAAAGNANSDAPEYPAAYPLVMAVSATDSNDNRAGFSNFGSNICVAAPGVDIFSTGYHPSPQFVSYATYSGTSQSSPHVAGLAALLLARNSALSNVELREAIEASADDLGAPGWDPYYGYGRVNAFQALLRISPPTDDDADELDDAWEIRHLGGTSAVAAADADLDHYDNLSEYVAGTNPGDSNDLLRLMADPAGNALAFTFTVLEADGAGYHGATRHYALQQKASLTETNAWSPLAGYDDLTQPGATSIVITPIITPAFYRLHVWLD